MMDGTHDKSSMSGEKTATNQPYSVSMDSLPPKTPPADPDPEREGGEECSCSQSGESSSGTLNSQQYSCDDQNCGCMHCEPECMQNLARPVTYLTCISALFLTQSLLVAGYTNSILTTIERRFNLWSSELGLIVSSYDISCMFAVIIVSYFGDRHNRPLWLGRGAVIMGIGSVLFTLPHYVSKSYTTEVYNATESDVNLCNSSRNMDEMSPDGPTCDSDVNPDTMALGFFILAQMVIGIGTAPIYTLGPTYLYDNVKPKLYAIYAGVMYSMSALGPALGFLMGALFLAIFVNPHQEPAGLTESDSNWVGAWWVGFLICSLLSVLVAAPLMMFPKELPGFGKGAEKFEGKTTSTKSSSIREDLKAFPRQLWRLLSNPVWLFISLTMVMEQSISTGFITFIAKYFEVSFAFTASKANIITGSVIIPGAFMGIITGGVLMKKLSLDTSGMTKLLLMMNIVPSLAVIVLLFLGCQNIDLAGITSAYTRPMEEVIESYQVSYKENLTATCNDHCMCSQDKFEPICGGDQRTYFSPCYAGCSSLSTHITPDGLTVRNYTSCSCIYESFVHSTAISGKCEKDCYNFIPFLVILFIVVFVTCCGQNPVLLITLRSVDASSRSFALGIQNVLLRLLAFIPAPVYFGQLFDSQCLLWTESCSRDGACLEYDILHLPMALFGTCLGIKLLTFVFLILTFYFNKRNVNKNMEDPGDVPAGKGSGSAMSQSSSQITTVSYVSSSEIKPELETPA